MTKPAKQISTAAVQMLIFGVGVLAGIALIALLPGMPWATVLADTTAEKQLAAETSAAAAAWWGVTVSAVSSVVGAVGLFLIYRTLQETQRSANAAHAAVDATHASTAIAEKIGHAQFRAYINITSVTATLGPASILIEVEYSNEGQSPGRNVVFRVDTSVKDRPRNVLRGYRFQPIRKSAVRIGENESVIFESFFEPPRPGQQVHACLYLDIEYDDVFRGYEEEQQTYEFHSPGMELMRTYRMERVEVFMD